MDILLGLDLGTSNCKVLAIDATGRARAIATAPTPDLGLNLHEPDASPEYEANAMWQLIAQLIRQVRDALDETHVLANMVGVCASSMAESIVLVDTQGEPVTTVLTWHDQRTKPWLNWWRERLSPLAAYRQTGLTLDHIYSAAKLQFYREHRPEAFHRATTFLGLADWITFKLTGVRSMSQPLASRTLLFDVKTRDWLPELFQLADIPLHLAPPVLPSGTRVGYVTEAAATLTGLPRGVPVSAGGHDHAGCGDGFGGHS